MQLIKKSFLALTFTALYTSTVSAWPGITRGQVVDQDTPEPFNTKCSYRVLVKESGISNEVDMVSANQLVFETLIDDPNDYSKSKKQIPSTFTIAADNKMKAMGSVIPGPYSSQFQKNLKAGDFEITEHSCVKLVDPNHPPQHYKYHRRKEG